jgi:CBS domain-containing protein
MTIRTVCNHEVITVKEDATVFEAAQLMRNHHVGDVVVVKENQGKLTPVGIVTDRDLVIEVVATALDCKVITVSDIMVRHLSVLEESAGVFETIQTMTSKGVRRLPTVDDTGVLTGIITLDDLLVLLSKEMGTLTKLISRELKNEAATRR